MQYVTEQSADNRDIAMPPLPKVDIKLCTPKAT